MNVPKKGYFLLNDSVFSAAKLLLSVLSVVVTIGFVVILEIS